MTKKGTPKRDGSGRGKRVNRGRGGVQGDEEGGQEAMTCQITQKARAVIDGLDNRDIAKRATAVLDQIASALDDAGIDDPPGGIWAGEAEDKSVGLGWICPGARMGFNIESEMAESGWFIVAKGDPIIAEYGLLSESAVADLVPRFLEVAK